jgi:hypothetical protein
VERDELHPKETSRVSGLFLSSPGITRNRLVLFMLRSIGCKQLCYWGNRGGAAIAPIRRPNFAFRTASKTQTEEAKRRRSGRRLYAAARWLMLIKRGATGVDEALTRWAGQIEPTVAKGD